MGSTPLLVAAAAGQSEAVTELLDAGAKVDAANDKGQTALHYAASKGNVSVSRNAAYGMTVGDDGSDGHTR